MVYKTDLRKGQFEMMEFDAETNGKTITFELENEVGAKFFCKI